MIFPITELLSDEASVEWIEKHFHPKGLRCPTCKANKERARVFRSRQRGTLDYRCLNCAPVFNLYHGTLFSGSNLRPRQGVLLVRGGCKGESAPGLAEEGGLSRQSVHTWRKRLQAKGYGLLGETPLKDRQPETDEMFQHAGEKRGQTRRPGRPSPASRQSTARPRHLPQ